MSATAQPSPTPRYIPKLFLAPRSGTRARSLLERLAGLYRLYGYGRSNMTEMVRIETERAALVLTAVFLFDIWGWSLVWNAIFHRGALEIDHRTLWAVTIGIIFAIVVISFEQGIITMDWTVTESRQRRRIKWAFVFRVLSVGASAFATAQPLELLIFSNDIEARVHEELAWEEVISRALKSNGLNKEYTMAPDTLSAEQKRIVDERQKVLGEANQKYDQAQVTLQTHQDESGNLQQVIPTLVKTENQTLAREQEPGLTPEEHQQREKEHTDALRKLRRARDRIEALKGIISADKTAAYVAQQEADRAQKEYVEAGGRLEDHQKATEQEIKHLQDWVSKVMNSKPSDLPLRDGDYEFTGRPYSFAEQSRVLSDILHARPIQRHNLLSISAADLKKQLLIDDPREADRATEEDRRATASSARMLYIAFFIVSLFVPCLGMLFKLTIHSDLAKYYSASWQASVGHPEAMQTVQTFSRSHASREGSTAYDYSGD